MTKRKRCLGERDPNAEAVAVIDEQNGRSRDVFEPGRRVKCLLVNGTEAGVVVKTVQTYAYTAVTVRLDSGETMKVEAGRVRVEVQKP